MDVINKHTGEVIYSICGHVGNLDEALDLCAPDDWRDQVNEFGSFVDETFDEEYYYDDLELED